MKIIQNLFFTSFILVLVSFSEVSGQNTFFFNQISGPAYSGMYSCTLTDGGDFIAAGRTDSITSGTQRGLVVCFDTTTGNIKWAKKTSINDLTFYAVDSYKDHIYYMGAYSSPSSMPHGLLVASDTSGNILWSYYIVNAYSTGVDVEATWDKGCISLTSVSANFAAGQISRFSPTGQLLWSRRIRFPTVNSLDAQSVTVAQDHSVFVTGRVQNIHGMEDVFIVKFDELGNLIWQKCITTGHDFRPSDIISLQNKDIVVAGWYDGVSTAVMCCDSAGNVKWLNNSSLSDYLNTAHLAETPAGNIMLAGNTIFRPDLVTFNPTGYPIFSREILVSNATFSQVAFGAGNRIYGVGMIGSQFNRDGLFVKAEENGYVGCNDAWLNSYIYPKNHSDSLSGYLVIDTLAYQIVQINVQFDTLTLVSNGCASDGIPGFNSNAHSLSVFPNPVNDQAIISWESSTEFPSEVLIYDESGKLMSDEKIISGSEYYIFRKNNLHAGTYHLLFLENGKYFSATSLVLCNE